MVSAAFNPILGFLLFAITSMSFYPQLGLANPGQPCLFAGWPSQTNQSGQCLSPSQIGNSGVSTASLQCPGGGVQCNPAYFGKTSNGNPLCVGGTGRAITDYTQECLNTSPNTAALIRKYRTNEGFQEQNIGTLGRAIGQYCSGGFQRLECQGELKVIEQKPGGYCLRGQEVTAESMSSLTSSIGRAVAAITGLSLAAIVGTSLINGRSPASEEEGEEEDEDEENPDTVPEPFRVSEDELDERGFARWDYLEDGEVERNPGGTGYRHDFSAMPTRDYSGSDRPANGGAVNSQLPQIGLNQSDRAREAGYYSYSPAERQWGTERTTWRLQEAGRRLAEQDLVMAIGNISKEGGGRLPPHSSHQRGVDIDLRLMGTNGRGYAGTYGSGEYSRDNTFRMIQALIDTDPQNVRHIIVNDPQLVDMVNNYYQSITGSNRIVSAICRNRRENNSRRTMHDNHIHFSWN
jgi:hypothetical protein